MYTFLVNGREVHTDKETNLLAFLREDMGLTSVKNGCAKGVCGACTVLVDGKNLRACLLPLSKLEGKSVLTLEGLSDRDKDVFSFAFAKAGAVQCGFCIPGMVMSAKAMLLSNPAPERKDVKKAIRGNICRCTGYKKIEDAILLAADIFNGKREIEEDFDIGGVGESIFRKDARAKTLGTAKYCDDVFFENMLHIKVLRAEHPRAKVLSIDTKEAEKAPGVAIVLTAKDIPGENYNGYVVHDWPTLIGVGDQTRYVGDAIAVVAAETALQAEAALAYIKVEYDVMEPVTDPMKAMQENALQVHPGRNNELAHVYINRNGPEEAIEGSPYVVTRTYDLPFTDHAFMEPESTVAFYKGDVLNVYSGTQNVYSDMRGLCRILALPQDKVRVRSLNVGGGFGGKEDMILQHHAALVTYYTKRPAKLTFTRQESLIVHPKRHAMRITITLGADREGNFTGLRSRIVADTGAYASMGAGVLRRACTHSCGPYRMPAVEMEGFAIYTNNPPAGAFRGFGVTQSAFALECTVDQMAQKLGIDPWEIRRKNALNPGDSMGPGQICEPDTAIVETLEAIRPIYERAKSEGKTVGIACAIKNAGMGGGKADIGRACLKVLDDDRVVLLSSAQCIGQGLETVMVQIASEASGVPSRQIYYNGPDTFCTPDSSATTASRQTMVTGEAVRRAGEALGTALKECGSLQMLKGRSFYGEYSSPTQKLNDPEILHPRNHDAYSYATDLVILDAQGKVEKIYAAHDVGRAINPQLVEGQIEGGVVMGLGYALRENFELDHGRVLSTYAKLGLFRADEIPELIPIIVEKQAGKVAYSAKGIGEISAIPVVPAVAGAYFALDGKERKSLPMKDTPYCRKG